ncbi:MAG TPA: hypothetical protein VIL49_14945 [Capillimicrobium sp.]|jgi:hypothetical protein
MRLQLPALTAAAAIAVALAAAPTAHGQQRVARFHVKVQGVQTIKWSSTSTKLIDCNGERTTTGQGTQVLRFASKGSDRIVFAQALAGAPPLATYNTWDHQTGVVQPGILVDTQVTRAGEIVHHQTGGWCGGASSTDTGPYDCGQRRDEGVARLYWRDARKVEVSLSELSYPKPYVDCPIVAPTGMGSLSWTSTLGRLSPKLLFGDRKQITVVDGDTFELEQPYAESFGTTQFKITLTRAG